MPTPPRPVGQALAAATAALLLTGLTLPPGEPAAAGADRRVATERAPAAAANRPLSEVLADLKTLRQDAGKAEAAHHRTGEKLRRQRAKVRRIERRLERTRTALVSGKERAGALARARYRTGMTHLPWTLRLFLADDPTRVLRYGHVLRRAAARQEAALRGLASTERHKGALVSEAREAMERREELAERKKRQWREVRSRLRDIERLLASLSDEQLARLEKLDITLTPQPQPQPRAQPQARAQSGARRADEQGRSEGCPHARGDWMACVSTR